VLELLTKYLVHARQVFIPSLGVFHVVHEPARYDVADKRILPPGCRVELDAAGNGNDQQVSFLSRELNLDQQTAESRLREFGEKLKAMSRQHKVEWAGVGELVMEQNNLAFHSFANQWAAPVDAPKVIHQGAQHVIRRGETEFTSAFEQQEAVLVPRRIRKTTIAWILLLAGLIFIVAWFFVHRFNPAATGLQL
jgi:hypothetical protein